MDTQVTEMKRLAETSPGELFVLINGRGNAICLRGEMQGADEPEDQRFVPLSWPNNEKSVGVAVHVDAIQGDVVTLPDARLEVDPQSACDGSAGTPLDVFQSDEGLAFPVVNSAGHIVNFIDAQTGTIFPNRGKWIAYTGWRITVPADRAERDQILGPDAQMDEPA